MPSLSSLAGAVTGTGNKKKSVSKVMNLMGSTKPKSSTSSSAKLNTSASKPSSFKVPPASMGTASLTSVAAKPSHSGVTLSEPDKIPAGTASPRLETKFVEILVNNMSLGTRPLPLP